MMIKHLSRPRCFQYSQPDIPVQASEGRRDGLRGPQVDQQDAEQNQSDTGIHDRRVGLQQGRNALKDIVQIKFFHGGIHINVSYPHLVRSSLRDFRSGTRPALS